METVLNVMSREVVTVTTAQPAYQALFAMDEHRLRHLPVLNASGELVGILSDRDLKRRVRDAFSPQEQSFDDVAFLMTEVKELMTPDPVFVYTDTSVERALEVMLHHAISSLIVLDGHRQEPVGIVTSTDMMRLLQTYLKQDAA
jgi:acetoin utilization protein AcuB